MQDILRRTLKSWQAVTGKQTPVLLEFDEEGLEHFRVVTQMRPLFVQMAGIHACETGDASGLTRWTRDDLLKSAVKREREYIQKKSSILIPSVCIERAVALLAFTGPQRLKADKWMKLLGDDAYACGYPGVQPGAVCDAVRDLLGVGAGGITPVGPDILAEAFSVSVLKETETNVVVLLKRILDLAGAEVWSRLLRAVIDLYNFEDLSIISDWIIDLLEDRPIDELYLIENLSEKVSVAHRSLLANLYEALLKKIPEEESSLPERARILNNLGNSYSDLGRREEALAAAARAVEIRERLAKRNPDAFEPDLAGSLSNLGAFHSDLGRREEALAAAARAVEIRERLAKRNPDAFEPDLAGSLNNLGSCHSYLGRREEALAAEARAVEIRERLAKRNPDAFEPYLAMSLNNLGLFHSDLGRREEALAAAARAVEISERLAKRNPDAFEPDLANSLTNLGTGYSNLGRSEEALAAAARAVEISERLAKRNPDAFEPDLAMSLTSLGNRYSNLGRREEALAAATRAVEISERLAKRNPDAFEPDLAISLTNLGIGYSNLGRREEALAAATRAVEIYERLAKRNPDAFEPNLAMSCGAKGAVLMAAGKSMEAADSFLAGINSLSRLFLRIPVPFSQLMASLVKDYEAVCKSSGVEPEKETLLPILMKLKVAVQQKDTNIQE